MRLQNYEFILNLQKKRANFCLEPLLFNNQGLFCNNLPLSKDNPGLFCNNPALLSDRRNLSAERCLFVVGAAYIYSGSNNERESARNFIQTTRKATSTL
jgi:hypothetical protein